MWLQILAIVWAQFRTKRNHLPRAGLASILGSAVTAIWYAGALALAVLLALAVPSVSYRDLQLWLAPVLFGLFILWQVVPLLTLSTGWSLQLNKLQIYPISNNAFFFIEVILRITASPELTFLLIGGIVGLLRHPALPPGSPLFLLLLLPLHLFVSLAVREVILHSFKRNRLRELFSILLILLAVLPQLLLRNGFGLRLEPYFRRVADNRFTPWHAESMLLFGPFHFPDLALLLLWICVAYLLARWFFLRSLTFEETPTSGSRAAQRLPEGRRSLAGISSLATSWFKDPLAALVQKEIRSLLRMPRFRVVFCIACILGPAVFFPLSSSRIQAGSKFLDLHFLPVIMLYGMLALSDTLLLNFFGSDRGAIAVYFVAPIPFVTVLKAKNVSAIFFLALQFLVLLGASVLLRRSLTLLDFATALEMMAVVAVFFLAIGNLTSVMLARPADPSQTLRKTAGGKVQFWLLACSLGMSLLLGIALLAQWALDSAWALLAALAIEFAIGLVVYKVALDSALERGENAREKLIDVLSKSAAPVGSNA